MVDMGMGPPGSSGGGNLQEAEEAELDPVQVSL
jgi:hypothetical protein